MNSRFALVPGMNHFEMRLIVLSQKNRLQTTQDGKLAKEFWWNKKQKTKTKNKKQKTNKQTKLASEIVKLLDFSLRNEFWYTGIQSRRFASDLEFEVNE